MVLKRKPYTHIHLSTHIQRKKSGYMANDALVHIIGNLTRDPQLDTAGASKVAHFSVAVDTTVKGDDGNFISDFYECSLFGKNGEWFCERAQKGTQVSIWGEQTFGEYTDKNGVRRLSKRITVLKHKLLQRWKTNGEGGGSTRTAAAAKPAPKKQEEESSDELPF